MDKIINIAIDETLWARVKATAALEQVTARVLVERALLHYLQGLSKDPINRRGNG